MTAKPAPYRFDVYNNTDEATDDAKELYEYGFRFKSMAYRPDGKLVVCYELITL